MRHFISIIFLALLVGCGNNDADKAAKKQAGMSNEDIINSNELLRNPVALGMYEYQGLRIPLYKSGTLVFDGVEQGPVYLTGWGLRRKTVAIVTVDVCIVASYAASKISATNPLESIKRSPREMIQLTMVRDVPGDKVMESINAALSANNVHFTAQQTQILNEAVSGGVNAGDSITFASVTGKDGLDQIVVQSPTGKYSIKGQGLGVSVWSMYFGNPADDGLATLKQSLLGLQ